MKSLFSYLMVMLAIMYWIFRVAVSLMYSMGEEFICQPLNPNIEIAILFLTIPSILFVIRRNTIGATLYFGMYAAYFGTILFNQLTAKGGNLTDILFSALGVIIPFLVFCDVLLQKSSGGKQSKDTDWYYENEKYDRQFDERADRNQYKIK